MADPTRGARTRAGATKKAPAKKQAPAKKAAAKKPPAKKQAAATASPAAVTEERRAQPLAATASRWSLSYKAAATVLVLAALVLMLKMHSQELGGPAHGDVSIGDGIPATLYLPMDADDDGDLPAPLPEDRRPPVIVMAHGYSADRASMSGLARSLAEAGYAVVSIDFRGHGANTHAFQGDLKDDLRAAVDWATTSPYVDGDRLAVLGHSMGASAVLDFATTDPRPLAVIPVSGGSVLNDEHVPANTLFLVASGDPDQIGDRQDELADDLSTKQLEGGGRPHIVRHTVKDRDHVTILRTDDTVQQIVKFLDPVLEPAAATSRGDELPGMHDPRYATAGLYLLVVLGLVALLGLAVGQTVPEPGNAATDRSKPSVLGFAVPAAALIATMPLLTAGDFGVLPLGPGQPLVMHLVLAGGLLWGGRTLARRGQLGGRVGALLGEGQWLPLRTAGWPGLVSSGIIVALVLPLAPVLHRLVPTPARAVFWVILAVAGLPFFAAYEALTRRGRGVTATLAGIGGRILLLVVTFVGATIGLLPFVLLLVLVFLIIQYALMEVFASTAFARGRNTALIAVVDAVLVAFMAVVLTPVG
jgi:dienelactone hydrolase